MDATTTALPNVPVPAETPQSDAIAENQRHIDRITYLASLASSLEAVDQMMEVLRGVTSTWDKSQPLEPEKIASLLELEEELKSYLISKDPVRSFTPESLERQLQSREQVGRKGKSPYLSLFSVLGLSILAAATPFGLPPGVLSDEGRMLVAIPLFFVVLHIGISWLYLSALKNFQQEVRKAFQIICIGVVLFGLSFSHYAIIPAFQLDQFAIFKGAGFTWIVALPFIFFFLGLRLYAKQIGVKSRLLSLKFVFAIAGVMVIITTFETLATSTSEGFDRYIDVILFIGGRALDLFSAIGAILAWKIRKSVAPVYARPMTWMFVYLFLSFVASALTYVLFNTGLLGGGVGGGVEGNVPFYIFMALAGVPVQLLLMWTGYVFKRELSK